MTAQRDSIPGLYRHSTEPHAAVRTTLDLGRFAFSHVEGFVVLSASALCIAMGYVLWMGN
jgi:hypothetical protein